MTAATEQATIVRTRGGSAAVRQRGDGPALVLLHATTHDSRDYDAIVGALAHRFRVVAVDFPGHGASPPAEDPGAPRFADVVEDVVDALELERVALIGNSVGGYAAARFAVRRPGRCTALVLVQTGGFNAPTLRVRLACSLFG